MTLPDLTLFEVEAARARVSGHIWRTPLERSAWLSERAGVDVLLKLECFQRTGSFKVRGAFNAVAAMSAAERSRGLVTASAGNHGQAVALAASSFGARCTVFVPATAPETKKSRIRGYGATLNESSATYDQAEDAALEYAADRESTFVHPYSDRAVVAGQGTVGLEILEDLPGAKLVVVPVGGGGLISGIGTVAQAAGVRVVGVQSELTRNMHDALEAGHLVDCPVVPTVADGLAGRTDEISVQRVRRLASGVTLVPERAITQAIRDLYRNHCIVAEGAGAVGLAALAGGSLKPDGPVAIVISGRNIDPPPLARILMDH